MTSLFAPILRREADAAPADPVLAHPRARRVLVLAGGLALVRGGPLGRLVAGRPLLPEQRRLGGRRLVLGGLGRRQLSLVGLLALPLGGLGRGELV